MQENIFDFEPLAEFGPLQSKIRFPTLLLNYENPLLKNKKPDEQKIFLSPRHARPLVHRKIP